MQHLKEVIADVLFQDKSPRAYSYLINVRVNPKGQSRMDNPEKLGILGTQDEDKKKHTTQFVMDTTICNKTQIT
jgi:hypothetical protein